MSIASLSMYSDPKPLLMDLVHESVIRVSGTDAVSFLQGQLSTDIEKLTPNLSQFSSWSNAKGRVVSLLRLLRFDDGICLSLPEELKDGVLKRLSMYVLRSKVTLTDAGKEMTCFGLAGDNTRELLLRHGIEIPQGANHMTVAGGICVIRQYGVRPRYALYGSPESISPLKQQLLAEGVSRCDENAWALEKILAGEPTVYATTREHFVAQMLDLDKLGAVDFKKGCYIGQEVIARAHYRGAVKRHMQRARCQTADPIAPGTMLLRAGTDQAAAEVVDARMDALGLMQLLVVSQDEYREAALALANGDAVLPVAGVAGN